MKTNLLLLGFLLIVYSTFTHSMAIRKRDVSSATSESPTSSESTSRIPDFAKTSVSEKLVNTTTTRITVTPEVQKSKEISKTKSKKKNKKRIPDLGEVFDWKNFEGKDSVDMKKKGSIGKSWITVLLLVPFFV